MAKNRMGSGLDVLLGAMDNNEMHEVVASSNKVALNAIELNPNQPRRHFDEESLQGLAQSIKTQGILQPILVEEIGAGRYRIVAGERRYRAAVIAGISEIPVIVGSFDVAQRAEIALLENIQREDLRPIEEAQAYHDLMTLLNLTQQELADRLGKNRSTLANSLRLLNLPPDLQRALNQNVISAGHGRSLASLKSEAVQSELFNQIVQQNLSVRQTEIMVATLGQKLRRNQFMPQGDERVKSNLAKKEKKEYTTTYGAKVVVTGLDGSGKIEINYDSSVTLQKIMGLLLLDKY
jgi:ParB family chromosome partitioning protein